MALGHQAHTPVLQDRLVPPPHQARILVLQDRLDPLLPQALIQVQLPLQTLILVPADQCHRLAHTAVPQFHLPTPVLLRLLPQAELCLLRAFTQAQVKRRRPAI